LVLVHVLNAALLIVPVIRKQPCHAASVGTLHRRAIIQFSFPRSSMCAVRNIQNSIAIHRNPMPLALFD
jgi:hypothetical protein